jgi:2-dehydropantoate 2-reductase
VSVVALKSYDTRWAAASLRAHLPESAIIVSAQNGMNEPVLQDIFGRDNVVGCVVSMAVELVGQGFVRKMSDDSWGTLTFGEVAAQSTPGRPAKLVDYFAPLGGVMASTDIDGLLWGKLILNSMSNCLGGLTGMSTASLWADEEVVEIAVVAEASGAAPTPVLRTIPARLLVAADRVHGAPWRETSSLMHEAAKTRAGGRDNPPSLLQDVRKGRRTEVDYLNGFIASTGESHGVPTPTHRAIVDAVHDLERGAFGVGRQNLAGPLALVRATYGG